MHAPRRPASAASDTTSLSAAAERMREADVRDQAVAEERADAPARAIEELIGNDEVERLVVLAQAADGARRQDPLDAEQLEAVDVGAEVQLGRQQPVAVRRAAPGTPRAARAASPSTYGPDGSPNGVSTMPLFAIGQLGHVVQAAAADDADLECTCGGGTWVRQ